MLDELDPTQHHRRSPVDGSITWSGHWTIPDQVPGRFAVSNRVGQSWRRTPLEYRIRTAQKFASELLAHEDEVAKTISLETGKPLWESISEVRSSASKVANSIDAIQSRRSNWSDHNEKSESVLRYRPLGCVAVVGPYNLPLHLPGAHIIPALLAGNTILFKPSEKTPAVGEWIANLWKEADLPPGVLQLVHGGPEVVQAMVDSPDLRGLFFTGSHRVGTELHRRLGGRLDCLVALELGGNNPIVVLDCDNEESAILTLIQSCYITSGQRCTCARRVIVVDTFPNRALVHRFARSISKIRVGNPFSNPAPFMGPMPTMEAKSLVLDAQEFLEDSGAIPLVKCRDIDAQSTLISPGLWDVTGLRLPDEEVFGPLATLQYVDDFDEAVQVANATRFGLSAGIINSSKELFLRFVQEVNAGIINWNSPTTGATGKLPFGGIGESGNHRASGFFASDYCNEPVASVQVSEPSLPDVYPVGLENLRV